jgi:hypothetical protein
MRSEYVPFTVAACATSEPSGRCRRSEMFTSAWSLARTTWYCAAISGSSVVDGITVYSTSNAPNVWLVSMRGGLSSSWARVWASAAGAAHASAVAHANAPARDRALANTSGCGELLRMMCFLQ